MIKGKVVEAVDADETPFRTAGRGAPYTYLGINQVFQPNLSSVKDRLTIDYKTRLKKIWSSELNAVNKARATNTWAVALFRYFFASLKWTQNELVQLDRTTRRIMRSCKCHQYGASVERVHLPREKGGRGVPSLSLVYQREVLSMAAYMCGSSDSHLRDVVKHQLYMAGRGRHSVLGAAKAIVEKHQLGIVLEEGGVYDQSGGTLTPKRATQHLRQAQEEGLIESLEGKLIHGVFYKQCHADGWDQKASHGWLLDGRVQGRTEGLIVAAQDGVIHTCAYLARVLKKPVSPLCRGCRASAETLGHLLSKCEPLQWTLYKERHDRVLYQVVLALMRKYSIKPPEWMKWSFSGWAGVGVLLGDQVKLVVDVSTPTERQLRERRPDLIVYDYASRRALIFEVACAWEPLII